MRTHIRAQWVAAAVIAVSCAISGCATPKNVPDRTPGWMKRDVLGSRIARPVDARGEADSANYTVTTSADQLSRMPSVWVNGRRRR